MAFIIDTARVNARTVAVLRGAGNVAANRNFAFLVVRGLVTPHILRRMAGPGIQTHVKTSAENYLGKTDSYHFTVFQCFGSGFRGLLDPNLESESGSRGLKKGQKHKIFTTILLSVTSTTFYLSIDLFLWESLIISSHFFPESVKK